MRKTRAVWHPPWTVVDTLGPARPTLTSYLVVSLGGLPSLGAGEGGGRKREEPTSTSCRMQTFRSVCNGVFHVGTFPANIAKCRLRAGCQRGFPGPLRAVALAARGLLSRLVRGCRGEGRQRGFPSWNSGTGEPSLAGPALARPAKSCLPWGTLAESSLSRGCSSKLP